MKSYQFKIYPTKKQKRLIDLQLEEHRLLYNHCLAHKKKKWDEEKTNVTWIDLINLFVKDFKQHSNHSSLQTTVRRLNKTYNKFFRKHSRFPRFKGRGRFRTIEYLRHTNGCSLRTEKNKAYFQNIGDIRCHIFMDINVKTIKTMAITKKNKDYYANVIIEESPVTENNIDINNSVGVDFGVANVITTDKNETFVNNRESNRLGKKIKSYRRNKNKKAINKTYKKIQNLHSDFNHKLSRFIVDKYDVICMEKINSSKFKIKNAHSLNVAISDSSLGQLARFIQYKAESAGKKVVLVDPKNTSRMCSSCGNIDDKKLSQKIHHCKKCGHKENRDINAAKNILSLGLQTLGVNP